MWDSVVDFFGFGDDEEGNVTATKNVNTKGTITTEPANLDQFGYDQAGIRSGYAGLTPPATVLNNTTTEFKQLDIRIEMDGDEVGRKMLDKERLNDSRKG